MAAELMSKSLAAQCPHGGSIQGTAASQRVMLSGEPLLVVNDQFQIEGCFFMVGTKAQPCKRVQWLTGASRVRSGGNAVLLRESPGLCQSAEQILQGSPLGCPKILA